MPELTPPPPYCDANLTGSRVQLVVDRHVLFNGQAIPVPTPGQNVLYLRLSPNGAQFAGVGHVDNRCWEWDGTWHNRGPAEGQNPVIYDANGVLQIVRETEGAPTGSQGPRYVDDADQIVSADSTIADEARHIWQYTTRGDITVGQGGDEEGLQALVRGRRVRLATGRVRNVHFYRGAGQIVIACVRDAATPLFFDFRESELDALPTYELPSPPIVTPDPIPGPPTPGPGPGPVPEPEPKPVPPPAPTPEDSMLPHIGDNEIIELSQRWIQRYQVVGRYDAQSPAENIRDEAYWIVVYARAREKGKDHEQAMRVMENGMATEVGQPIPFP